MQLLGLDGLKAQLAKLQADAKLAVEDERRRAVDTIVRKLIENIPVWSGRTIRSIRVNNSGAYAPLEDAPTRAEAAAFGRTSTMPLGSEPMRGVSEAQALGQVSMADYDMRKPLFITIHSDAWGLVEQGEAPTKAGARNTAVVSEIAKQAALVTVKGLRSG